MPGHLPIYLLTLPRLLRDRLAYIEFVDREGELRPASAPWRSEAALGDSGPGLPEYMQGRFAGLQEAGDIATAQGGVSAAVADDGVIEDVEAEEIVVEAEEIVVEEAEEVEVVDVDDNDSSSNASDPKKE